MARSSEDIVYEFVCSNPGLSTYAISKKLRMSGGRVRHALSKLKERGLVKFKFERQSPRIRKLTYPVNAFDLLPKGLKKEVKKFQVVNNLNSSLPINFTYFKNK